MDKVQGKSARVGRTTDASGPCASATARADVIPTPTRVTPNKRLEVRLFPDPRGTPSPFVRAKVKAICGGKCSTDGFSSGASVWLKGAAAFRDLRARSVEVALPCSRSFRARIQTLGKRGEITTPGRIEPEVRRRGASDSSVPDHHAIQLCSPSACPACARLPAPSPRARAARPSCPCAPSRARATAAFRPSEPRMAPSRPQVSSRELPVCAVCSLRQSMKCR